MIKGLLYASITEFFDRVPTGRILSRISKDLRSLDESMGDIFGRTLYLMFTLLANLAICVYASTPWILIPVFLFLLMCYSLKNYYMNTQRECIRLDNISNSPIVSGFNETIHGLPTLRAYNVEQQFLQRQSEFASVNKRNKTAR
jgi:ABC-type multidrug transport system fused ATPase/permease subunit